MLLYKMQGLLVLLLEFLALPQEDVIAFCLQLQILLIFVLGLFESKINFLGGEVTGV